MRLLYVVQRYGEDIVGGSEAACRQFAEALTAEGHSIEVLTSCARSYVTWEDSYEPGTSNVNDVVVHRLPVREPRLHERFNPTNAWMLSHDPPPMLFEHQRWALLMGPDLMGLRSWLIDNCERFDAVVFMTYLYATATQGIRAIAGRVPVVFQPTAHDEPALKVPIFEAVFRLPDSYLFFTPEEREVVRERFNMDPWGNVVGIGIELSPPTGDVGAFRKRFGLGNDPYLIYVGRLDPMKGVKQLTDFFIEMKKQYPGELRLVLAGEAVVDLPDHEDVVVTGFLEESEKQAAIAGSLALVQSSYFESFSIVLCEAWVQRRPALVQAASTVLRGQARRSAGAIPYSGFAQFEQAVQMLLEDADLANKMGENGRRYVEQTYRWDVVLRGFAESVELAKQRFNQRPIHLSRGDKSEVPGTV